MAVATATGGLKVVDLAKASVVKEISLPEAGGKAVTAVARTIRGALALGLEDGGILLLAPRWQTTFPEGKRTSEFFASVTATLAPDPQGRPVRILALSHPESGEAAVASSPAPDVLFLASAGGDEPGASPFSSDLSPLLGGEAVSALSFHDNGRLLEAGTVSGKVLSFDVADPKEPKALGAVLVHPGAPAPVTVLGSLIGGQTLIAGDAKGRVAGLGRQRSEGSGEGKTLGVTKTYPSHAARVTAVSASPRGKTFLTGDEMGRVHATFATNERPLVDVASGGKIVSLAMAPKGDGFLALGTAGLKEFRLDAPHPEISWRSLFGKQLYEGYDRPEYVWQSTGATDDFESKMSLVPLIFGTLKGTLYALLFAVPIALAAALYTSRLRAPEGEGVREAGRRGDGGAPVRRDRLPRRALARSRDPERHVHVAAPLSGRAARRPRRGLRPRGAPYELRQRITGLHEIGAIILLTAAGVALCAAVGPVLERLLFAGDFHAWLYSALHLRYDARNSLVIAFAMGFAVIPIIFTISEDALSSVPQHLKAASLALGASPWQTATRVILPTASAGIFSALMVGFGRAVGETMIVLMATGNTPIMEWSLFNGMRTLSANIAVEISEAPEGGTLFRVLFLSALLLFLLTFLVNTLAEVMRQRLRKKYTVI